jgi:hypothetical protein
MRKAARMIRSIEDLVKIVDRRIDEASDAREKARANREALDENYIRGQLHELMTMQDLLAAILKHPRTYYASSK